MRPRLQKVRLMMDSMMDDTTVSIIPTYLHAVRQGLINALAQEQDKNFRHKIGHVIAQVASELPEGVGWPELLNLISQLMAAPSAEHREIGYGLLDSVAEYRSHVLAPCASQLAPALASGLSDADIAVKNAALKATCSCAMEMDHEGIHSGFRGLIPDLLTSLQSVLMQNDHEAAQESLGSLVLLTEQVPKFWRESLDIVVPMLSAVIAAPGVDLAVKITAIEWATTLAEKCPARFRRGPWLGSALLPQLVELVSMPPPDEENAVCMYVCMSLCLSADDCAT